MATSRPSFVVARAIDLAHAALAEQRLQLIASRAIGRVSDRRLGREIMRDASMSAGSARNSSDTGSSSSASTSRRIASSSGQASARNAERVALRLARVPRDTALRAASSVQVSCDRSPRISRISQAFASRQSRITVSGDTFSTPTRSPRRSIRRKTAAR